MCFLLVGPHASAQRLCLQLAEQLPVRHYVPQDMFQVCGQSDVVTEPVLQSLDLDYSDLVDVDRAKEDVLHLALVRVENSDSHVVLHVPLSVGLMYGCILQFVRFLLIKSTSLMLGTLILKMMTSSRPERRVLVIDDNEGVAQALKSAINVVGSQVAVFNDPREAVASFRAAAYDLVLLDMRMPTMNGFEVYRELRKVDGSVRICLLSVFDIYEREFSLMFPEARIHAFLTKPVDLGTITRLINDLPPQRVLQRSSS
jgi:CheY-like chemotaxis protein